MGYRIGIDTGGTFTDLILAGRRRRVELFKTPSTPTDPPAAIRNGLDGDHRTARPPDAASSSATATCHPRHHRRAQHADPAAAARRSGLFCTRGHEDSLEIRQRPQGGRASVRLPLPAGPDAGAQTSADPVSERVLSDGSVRLPLDEDDVLRGIVTFRREGVRRSVSRSSGRSSTPTTSSRVGEILRRRAP